MDKVLKYLLMYEIIPALNVKVTRFWATMQCGSADKYQRNTRTLIK